MKRLKHVLTHSKIEWKNVQKCHKKLKNKFLQTIKNHSITLEIQSRDRHKAIKSIAMVQSVFSIHLVCPKVVSQICRKHIRPDPITSKIVSEITILSRRGGECFAPTRPTMCVGRSPKYMCSTSHSSGDIG